MITETWAADILTELAKHLTEEMTEEDQDNQTYLCVLAALKIGIEALNEKAERKLYGSKIFDDGTNPPGQYCGTIGL